MPIKILVMASTFPRWHSDAGKPSFIYDLCQRLSSEDTEIHVLTPHFPKASLQENFGQLIVHRFRYLPDALENLAAEGGINAQLQKDKLNYLKLPFLLLAQFLALHSLCRRNAFDVIHAHWILPQGLLAVIYKKIFFPGLRVIGTSHGSDLLCFNDPLSTVLKRFTLRGLDRLTTVSDALRKIALQLCPLVNVSVIPMGIDTERFQPGRFSTDLKKKYSVSGPLLLFVGRLSAEKKISLILQSMPYVLHKFPEAKLLIVGEGPEYDTLLGLRQELDIVQSVIFPGSIRHEDLPVYYASADLFVSLPAWEGFGLTFIEAMACGCCVLTTKLESLQEIIADGQNGFLVDPPLPEKVSEKIVTLLNDAALRKSIGQAGRDYVRRLFAWEVIAAKYREVLSSQKK